MSHMSYHQALPCLTRLVRRAQVDARESRDALSMSSPIGFEGALFGCLHAAIVSCWHLPSYVATPAANCMHCMCGTVHVGHDNHATCTEKQALLHEQEFLWTAWTGNILFTELSVYCR